MALGGLDDMMLLSVLLLLGFGLRLTWLADAVAVAYGSNFRGALKPQAQPYRPPTDRTTSRANPLEKQNE